MAKYRLFNDNSKLTDVAKLIMAEDIEALGRRIDNGWDINEPMEVCDSVEELPVAVALVENKLRVVDLLLDRGADLNVEGSPAIVDAAPNCKAETLRRLVAHGATVDAVDRVGKNAYSAALYWKRYDLLPTLLELGLKVDADGGRALRQAVSGRQYRAVEFFIAQGIDVNLRKPDMVYPYNPTALGVAAGNGDVRMMKLLVESGADVLAADAYGCRPYLEAVIRGCAEAAEYLKSLEPEELHDPEARARKLAENGVPAGLIALLRSDERRMDLGDIVGDVRLHSVTDAPEVNWLGRRFFDLVGSSDNYDAGGLLVWSVSDGKLGYADYEHEEFHVFGSWDEFIADPGKWWDDIL